MYGHIKQLAEAEKRGIEAAGGTCTFYQYLPLSPSPSIPTNPPHPQNPRNPLR